MNKTEEGASRLADAQKACPVTAARQTMTDRMADEKKLKLERYRRLNKMVRPHQILFAGSSLMEQFPIYELLLDRQLPYTIYNRGIGGYTTQELLDSMDTCIYALEPDYIYINIGTNDINRPGYTPEGMIRNYREILNGIREHLPQAKLYLLAYYPVNPIVGEKNEFMREALKKRTNARIQEANAAVKKLAAEFGAAYLDLNAGITDKDGNLNAAYTVEGMHMYADGYAPVLDALMPFLPDLESTT